MSNPTAIELVRSMTYQQYFEYVVVAFTDAYNRAPYEGAYDELRFWHSINVHPDSAVVMLEQWGY
jgi:hypothetical protein